MHSDAQLQSGVRHVTDLEVAHGRQEVEAHCGYLPSVVVPVANRQPRHHHVWSARRASIEGMIHTSAGEGLTGVSDSLNFVDIEMVDNTIKTRVEIIEQVHHLQRSAAPGNLSEPNNVTEVDSDALKALSSHRLSLLQLLNNSFW